MHAEIESVFSKIKSDEVLARLDAADIANARLNDMHGFWNHPQLKARGRRAKVGSPAGALELLKPPFNISGLEPRLEPIPAPGEHSRSILRELGYAEHDLDTLAASGAI